MDQKETKSVFELIDGLTSVDPQEFKEFEKAMIEKVIPEIVEIIDKRRLKATESRHWQLKRVNIYLTHANKRRTVEE